MHTRLAMALALACLACPGSVSTNPPCGGSCNGATPFCQDGQCLTSCMGGRVGCGGLCVDTNTDEDHCGRCDNQCAAGVSCESGSCGGDCAGLMCGSTCVDQMNDPRHCGQCNRSCGEGGTCLGGECRCGGGTTDCGEECVDTTSDIENCGGCGEDCEYNETCVNSECVCGGEVCSEDQLCLGGACACRPGLEMDGGGNCYDPQTDPDACGSPPQVCGGGTAFCQDGLCVSGCSDGNQACGMSCVDLDDSPLHCGLCFRACDGDALCVNRQCRDFEIAQGCSMCPCDDCGGGERCCSYEGALVCIDASECPGD